MCLSVSMLSLSLSLSLINELNNTSLTTGHVYAIGDCGGATSTGRCPECRAEIGGMNYQLRPGNIHTGVMDDSTDPAWSNAANMAEGFNAQFFD